MPVAAFGRLRFSLSLLGAVLLIAHSRLNDFASIQFFAGRSALIFRLLTLPAAHVCRKSPIQGLESDLEARRIVSNRYSAVGKLTCISAFTGKSASVAGQVVSVTVFCGWHRAMG